MWRQQLLLREVHKTGSRRAGDASLAAAGAVSADVSSIVIMLGGIVVIAILNNYDTKAGTGDMELKLTKNK